MSYLLSGIARKTDETSTRPFFSFPPGIEREACERTGSPGFEFPGLLPAPGERKAAYTHLL